MTGLEILVLVLAILVIIAVAAMTWIHRRRTGRVLIADVAATRGPREPS